MISPPLLQCHLTEVTNTRDSVYIFPPPFLCSYKYVSDHVRVLSRVDLYLNQVSTWELTLHGDAHFPSFFHGDSLLKKTYRLWDNIVPFLLISFSQLYYPCFSLFSIFISNHLFRWSLHSGEIRTNEQRETGFLSQILKAYERISEAH